MDTEPSLITRWDLDKTYLRTEFHTLQDLWRSAIERPDQKRAVPGAARLLRELHDQGARIHILSGSPRQMRRSLAERLSLDGVVYEELTLKPNLSNLLQLRFHALKDQLSYKLPALLTARLDERARLQVAPCPEVLVGDDSEADAFVYSLYADLCLGHVDRPQLQAIFSAGEVEERIARQCFGALEQLRSLDGGLESLSFRILIHLDQQTPPSRFASYGKRLVPFYNYAQATLVLLEDGQLTAEAAYRVAQELCDQFRFDLEALARSYLDLKRRGHLRGHALEALAKARPRAPTEVAPWPDTIAGELHRDSSPAREVLPARLDYVALASHHKGGKNRRR
jgi:hypothetical protein